MAEARKDRRTLLSMKIRYKSATLEDFIERYSNDISRGGIFIKAKKPLAVGTLLKFEFILQDQSTLIHGVGRVVWRRDESEADAENPSGMGIKFIKMDPESRSVVQRIAEGRVHPGVFEQGKDGVSHDPAVVSGAGDTPEADRTKVRHVSEFLASALEEGGAGEAAKREARAGADRARLVSDQMGGNRGATARGAFSANSEVPIQKPRSASEAPSRGAMSAFGGAAMSASARSGSSAAPAMDQLKELDDFLEEETTKIQEFPRSEYPDADATVISREAAAPFVAERRRTPVVPFAASLQEMVPDLFGPAVSDSFGPAPGEFIDASLLDPSVATVPPPRGSVPDAPGIPAEAFRVPQAAEPVWTTRPAMKKTRSRAWMLVLLFVFFAAAAAVAVWQLGLANDLMGLAAPYLGESEALPAAPVTKAQPLTQPVAAPPTPQ
ncbi:MAG: TIGR02266 family protein, partial [Burkholderiales bacterium]